MEETLQQEKQELEYTNPNEEQGGIRRRLRDRDLLKKRKAEAEEKETNQVESQRKRPRADAGTKRRGRPKKTERTAETSVVQEEATAVQEAPLVVAVPEPAEVIPDQPSGSLPPLLAVESQPSSVPAAPAPQPMFGSNQIPVFGPPLTSPTQVNLTPALFPPSAVVPSPAKFLDTAPIPVSDSSPAPDAVPFPVPVPTQALVPAAAAAPPTAPPQVETLFTESQGREALDQILIEELGPDKEADTSLCQDKVPDEDLIATPLINVPEQNEIFSLPTLSSTSPQKYFPGSTF